MVYVSQWAQAGRNKKHHRKPHLERVQLGDGLGQVAPLHVVRRAGQHLSRIIVLLVRWSV